MVVMISFPVIRIAFQHNALSRKIFLHPKRTQTNDLGGWSVQQPSLREMSLAIRFFEDVLRQHRQAVEDSLRRGIWARQRESYGVLIQFGHAERLIVDDQQVTLRRTHRLIQINGE